MIVDDSSTTMSDEGLDEPLSSLNEPLSELSIDEEWDEDPLQASSFRNESQDTQNISAQSTLSCDSRGLDSQSTFSNISDTDDISSFKKFPELGRYFKKRRLSKDKIETTCQACSKQMHTQEIKRLISHASRCGCVTEEDKEYLTKRLSLYYCDSRENRQINLLWAKVIVENNIPMSCVTSNSFKKFVATACPSWKPSSRHRLTSTYIASLSQDIKTKFLKEQEAKNSYLSVEFDHWLDANNRSLLGVVMSYDRGSRYICDLIDVSIEGHSTSVIVEKIVASLEQINPSSVNAFVSDSASSCKLAREELVKLPQFRHALQHRCLAHLTNRIGDSGAKSNELSTVLKWASRLASTVSNSPSLTAKIRVAGKTRVKPFCQVRWYSQVDMVESLVAAKDVIVEELSRSSNTEHRELVKRSAPWKGLERALEVIRPIAHCIAITERNDSSLGQGFRALLDLGRALFESDWHDTFNLSTITAYLTYVCPKKLNNAEFGLLIAAYALDPRYALEYLTVDGQVLALETLTNIAISCGCSSEDIKNKLAPQFEAYTSSLAPSNRRITNQKAVDWWRTQSDSGALRAIAIKLTSLKSSSANIERTFSTLKYIQGSNRLRLSLKTLIDIARIKVSMLSREKLDRDMKETAEIVPAIGPLVTDEVSEDQEDLDDTNVHSVMPAAVNHHPELLERKYQRNYEEFCRYIDFSVVASQIDLQPNQPTSSIAQQEIDEILSNFRSKRTQIVQPHADS